MPWQGYILCKKNSCLTILTRSDDVWHVHFMISYLNMVHPYGIHLTIQFLHTDIKQPVCRKTCENGICVKCTPTLYWKITWFRRHGYHTTVPTITDSYEIWIFFSSSMRLYFHRFYCNTFSTYFVILIFLKRWFAYSICKYQAEQKLVVREKLKSV